MRFLAVSLDEQGEIIGEGSCDDSRPDFDPLATVADERAFYYRVWPEGNEKAGETFCGPALLKKESERAAALLRLEAACDVFKY